MAEKDKQENVTKRPRYFHGQFLQEEDFKDEQSYHIDRQERHNRCLHHWGIADGLEVNVVSAQKVEVTPGTAVDEQGQQIFLKDTEELDLSDEDFENNREGIVVISYHAEQLDEAAVGGKEETRWHEQPEVKIVWRNRDNTQLPAADTQLPAAGMSLQLAKLSKNAEEMIISDLKVRTYACARLRDETEVQKLILSHEDIGSDVWPSLSAVAVRKNPENDSSQVIGRGIRVTQGEQNAQLYFKNSRAYLEVDAETDSRDDGKAAVEVEDQIGLGAEDEASLHLNSPLRFTSMKRKQKQRWEQKQTLMYHRTGIADPPVNDGFRLRYDYNFFGKPEEFRDALIIEKTESTGSSPDGGIAFVNTGVGEDGTAKSETALVIRGVGKGESGAGKVGIGTKDPECALDVNGAVRAEGLFSYDDVIPKKNIESLSGVLNQVLKLRGVRFQRKAAEDDGIGSAPGVQIGVIGQEVEQVVPEVVSTDTNGRRSVDYGRLVAVLIEAIKELKAEKDALEQRVAALEA